MSLSAARAPPLTQQSPRMHLTVCACVCRLRIRQPCPRAGGAPSSAQSCPRRACTLHSTSPPSAARPGCPAGLRTAAGALSHRSTQPQPVLMPRHTLTRRTSAKAASPHRHAHGSGGATKRSVHNHCAGVTALLAWAPLHPGQVSCLVWMSSVKHGVWAQHNARGAGR